MSGDIAIHNEQYIRHGKSSCDIVNESIRQTENDCKEFGMTFDGNGSQSLAI